MIHFHGSNQIDLIERKAYTFLGASGEQVKEIEIPEKLLAKVDEKRHDLIARLADVDEEIEERELIVVAGK